METQLAGTVEGGGDGREETVIDHDLEDHGQDHDHEFEEHDHGQDHEQINADSNMEHLPEPPASPTLLSTPSNSDAGGNGVKVESSNATTTTKARVPSANRISISYAGGNRRLVIDAEVVQSMKVLRQAGMIEVVMDVTKFNENELKGILVRLSPLFRYVLQAQLIAPHFQFEVLSDTTKSYTALPALLDSSNSNSDVTLPPFWKLVLPATVTLLLYLDTERPLSEPKWAKTGDVQEWLRSMFGRMFWVAGEAAEGWEKKIHVVDPDPVGVPLKDLRVVKADIFS
jgi:20S proteasome subunit alpha 6